ncbi:hypothetical protein D3C71_931560 [compost metagenome]
MAATDIERLIVALEARTKAFENALAKANGTADKRARAIQRRFESMNKGISSGFSEIGAAALRAFALIGGAQGLKTLSDSATSIDNALKVAGLSGAELEKVYQSLFAAATKNAAPIETLVGLYGRLSLIQGELGVNSEQIVSLSNNVGLALRVYGANAQSASGAILGLTQALGNGKVQAEDWNQILDGAPTILQAAAAGIREADGSVAKLRQIMLDGELSSKAFFDGFQAGAPILEQRVAGAVLTIYQRLTNLNTALINAAREFNNSSKAGETFGNEIDRVASFVNSINFNNLIGEIQAVIGALNNGIAAVNSFMQSIGNLSGLDNVGGALVKALGGENGKASFFGGALTIESTKNVNDLNDAVQRQVDLQKAIETTNANSALSERQKTKALAGYKQQLAETQAQASKLAPGALQNAVNQNVLNYPTSAPNFGSSSPSAVKPISIKDTRYAVSGGSSGSGKSGGGRGGRSANEYQREIEQIRERTEALNAETTAMSQVNPLVNDYGFAIAKARAESDLLTAAQRAGMEVTPELRASIDQLSTGYANASVAAEKLSVSQDQAKRAAEDFKDTSKDIASGFISDLRSGASASEALASSLNKVLDKLIDIGLNSIFGTGGGGGGLFGGLFKLFGFANGGIASRGKPMKKFARGGVARNASIFGEAGPEAAVPLPDGRRIPVDLNMPKRGGGSSDVVTINLQADRSVIAETADQRIESASGTIVKVAVNQSTQRVVPTMAAYQQNKAGAEWR